MKEIATRKKPVSRIFKKLLLAAQSSSLLPSGLRVKLLKMGGGTYQRRVYWTSRRIRRHTSGTDLNRQPHMRDNRMPDNHPLLLP